MPKVLLTTLNAKYIHTNLAIRLLYQLNKKNEGLTWKEFTIKEEKKKIADFCSGFEVVAFSCYIWNITPTLEVCRLIKLQNPDTKILLGGPEVSYDYEEVILLSEVDYIIAGEGETAFGEFLELFPAIDHVPNLVFKNEGSVLTNPAAPLFDLKKLEHIMPYADDATETLPSKVLYVETSRGCPYKCEFCLASLDNKVRYLPDASIRATLLHLMEHGRVVKFLDRTFNIKRDFSISTFQFILDHYKPGNVFQFEITADIVHPDIIQFIQDKVPAGLFRFEIGIQTVNQSANLAVSRKQNFDKTSTVIRKLQNKVEMHLDLIVGLPLDRFTDIRHSIEEVFALHAPELQLGFLKFLKGTPVRDKHNAHGYVFDPLPPYQIIRSNYLSENELKQVTHLEHALEIYWNGGKAIHTLKYVSNKYSIFDFLLKLGTRFIERFGSGQYNTEELYDEMMNLVTSEYFEDTVLRELVSIDYYLHFKLLPAVLDTGGATPQKGKKGSTRTLHLQTGFDFELFVRSNDIVTGSYNLIFRYDGIHAAHFIQSPDPFLHPAL